MSDKRKFAIYAAMLQEADHDRIGADVQTAVNEDQNFGGVSKESLQERMLASFADYSAATKASHRAQLTRKLAAGTRAVTPAEYVDLGAKAREAELRDVESSRSTSSTW